MASKSQKSSLVMTAFLTKTTNAAVNNAEIIGQVMNESEPDCSLKSVSKTPEQSEDDTRKDSISKEEMTIEPTEDNAINGNNEPVETTIQMKRSEKRRNGHLVVMDNNS